MENLILKNVHLDYLASHDSVLKPHFHYHRTLKNSGLEATLSTPIPKTNPGNIGSPCGPGMEMCVRSWTVTLYTWPPTRRPNPYKSG